MTLQFVASADEILEGKPLIVEVDGRSIGLFRIGGELLCTIIALMQERRC